MLASKPLIVLSPLEDGQPLPSGMCPRDAVSLRVLDCCCRGGQFLQGILYCSRDAEAAECRACIALNHHCRVKPAGKTCNPPKLSGNPCPLHALKLGRGFVPPLGELLGLEHAEFCENSQQKCVSTYAPEVCSGARLQAPHALICSMVLTSPSRGHASWRTLAHVKLEPGRLPTTKSFLLPLRPILRFF